MSNPWLKKNPFMSMWLSGANAAASSLRGTAISSARRQSSGAATQMTGEFLRLWMGPLSPVKGRSACKRKRR